MPTYEALPQFWRDWEKLRPQQKRAFLVAVRKLVEDLKAGGGFRPGPRVRGVQGAEGIYEVTWADDGRATFEYGESQRAGDPHIIWRRCGTHEILRRP